MNLHKVKLCKVTGYMYFKLNPNSNCFLPVTKINLFHFIHQT